MDSMTPRDRLVWQRRQMIRAWSWAAFWAVCGLCIGLCSRWVVSHDATGVWVLPLISWMATLAIGIVIGRGR